MLCGPNPKTENGADIFEAISAPALVRRDLEACLHRTVYTDQVRNAQAPYTKQSHAHNGWPTTSGMRAARRDREAEVLLDNDTQRHDRRTAGRAQSRSTQGGAVSDEETGITHGHAESANPQ